MRENRPYGSEGGESGSTGLPYPYVPLLNSRVSSFELSMVQLPLPSADRALAHG